MGKRQRIRKERKIAEQEAIRAEIASRYYEETKTLRRHTLWLTTAIVVFALGGFLSVMMPRINAAISSTLSGPYGTLPKVVFNSNDYALLKTENGDIKIKLDHSKKVTTANFMKLVQDGFYKGTSFHRVIEGFMIQGGDPNSKDSDPANDGQGGPGYNIPDELTGKETYTRGTVAMANTSQPNTGGSQFFIVQQDSQLPPSYTVFGQVVEGMETVDAIVAKPNVVQDGQKSDRPVTPVKVLDVVLLSK